jgi:pilus assembly protein CpaE
VSGRHANPLRSADGTASVELIGVLPALLVALLVAAQLAAAGYALWSASLSARAGARSAAVGGDAAAAARRALPPLLRSGARIGDGEGLSVRVAVPRMLPGLPRVEVGARTELPGAGGA